MRLENLVYPAIAAAAICFSIWITTYLVDRIIMIRLHLIECRQQEAAARQQEIDAKTFKQIADDHITQIREQIDRVEVLMPKDKDDQDSKSVN